MGTSPGYPLESLAPRLSTDLLKTEEFADDVADLLGLNTVYDWIKHGRHKEIDIGHEKVDSKWDVLQSGARGTAPP